MITIDKFNVYDLDELYDLIQFTINKCYPEIYPPEIVDFFLNYHSKNEILRRAEAGTLLVLRWNNKIIATGFINYNEFGGVYVHPDMQGMGYGSFIVEHLLKVAAENKIIKVHLDSTPIAKRLYEKLGFQLVSPAIQMVGDIPLEYFKMEKNI
jgi:GNAT superfamily N-acetyltransferase